MNYIFRIITFILFINTCFSQYKREVNIKSSIDTTQTEFREIYNLWENYVNELNYRNADNHFLLKEFDEKLNSYWLKTEVENYKLCDLTFSFMSGYGNVMYPLYKEYFLGFVKRDSNMYEIKTMFISPFKENPHDFPTLMMTVMVIKTGDSFKLCNKFTLNRLELLTKKFANITYYYPPFYKFNDSLATTLSAMSLS